MEKLFLLFVILVPNIVLSIECFKVDHPQYRMIYLHGMDIPAISNQEKNIRQFIKNISRKLQIEIALPRANMKCPNNPDQICWMWGAESSESLNEKKNRILNESKDCFNSASPLVWLGFSNGGNLLTQFFQVCMNETFLTIGASGGVVTSKINDFSKCGIYRAAIGENDKWNYQKAIKFYNSLLSKKANVTIIPFAGGHEVSSEILMSLLTLD